VVIAHTTDTLEAWDFCRGVASCRPRSGSWALQSLLVDPDASHADLRRLGKTRCDGLIMMPGHWRTLEPLHNRGVKVISVDGDWAQAPYPCIQLDNDYIGQLAGEHLIQRGFSRVVYLGFCTDWSRERANGLHRAVARANGTCQSVLSNDWMQLRSEKWIIRQLRKVLRPFAVMACDDVIAGSTVRAVGDAGWHIPGEVGVIGVDDRITECIGVQPPLSSISNERFRTGQEAARLLDALFLGKPVATKVHRIRPSGVIERESTSTYVYDDPDVAAAVAFIHREACNGLSIEDVVRSGNLSRRTLERRFAEVLGRPPGDEIRRARIDAVKRSIERTHLPLADIAERCGFSCLSSMSHSFRLAAGMSPQAYRKKARAEGAGVT
jgi:LacI family transcriptional regulator